MFLLNNRIRVHNMRFFKSSNSDTLKKLNFSNIRIRIKVFFMPIRIGRSSEIHGWTQTMSGINEWLTEWRWTKHGCLSYVVWRDSATAIADFWIFQDLPSISFSLLLLRVRLVPYGAGQRKKLKDGSNFNTGELSSCPHPSLPPAEFCALANNFNLVVAPLPF